MRGALSGVAAQAGVSPAQLDDAIRHARVTISTNHSVGYPGLTNAPQGFTQMSYGLPAFGQPPVGMRRSKTGRNLVGGVIGLLGGCIGSAAALTAVFPSTALWTSAIVCGAPNQLMINTSHSSYRAGQSTNIAFQCLIADRANRVNFLTIGALQLLLVVASTTSSPIIPARPPSRTRA